SDKANHGFGLKGIKEIAERYHGSLELQSANGIFDLFLYIPLT
ncbi:MAG: ATP-binding protein, partial [Lachnospiraceae bacterium]|nr:ATP-binding protein [Lachnospiraceae bacterium]